jgi:hypothetical protein
MSKVDNYLLEIDHRDDKTQVVRGLQLIGQDLSEIINQDGDEKNDGQVLDEIVKYLKELNIYKERI